MLQVSAPGKLFVLGEYAVLEGAPALLTAVDRRVRVTLESASTRHWSLTAPDIGLDHVALDTQGGLPAELDASTRQRLRIFAAVRAEVATHANLDRQALAIHIDSHAFSANGCKLGLGSSAAVAAALTAALTQAAGASHTRDTICRRAISAHRRAQNGAGSGADVATSCHGGVIEYRADTVQATLAWPAGITGMAVATGNGASTTDLVGRVRALGQRAPARYNTHMARLTQLAHGARAALADADRFLTLAHAYFAALQALDDDAQAGIVLQPHRELARLAARHGGVFKTTGAGGGDLGLAFAHSGAPARRLAAALSAAGSPPIPLAFGAHGLETHC